MKKHLLALAVISIAFLTSCKKNDLTSETPITLSADSTVSKTISGQFVPNELLVKFKAGTGEKSRTQTLSFINGQVSEHILTAAMQSTGDNQGIYLVNTTTDVFSAIARMKGESNIEYAEPNWIYTHTQTSNDFYYVDKQLWGMYSDDPNNLFGAIGTHDPYGSQAEKAWANGHIGSRNIIVGVIDEGIQFEHPDLVANIWTNPYETIDGIDNDGNGYKDDIHGWDFDGNNNSIYDGGTKGTVDQHGTHVSGTIGGMGGNQIGVAGVNWQVTIISAKFLGRRGGTTANAVKAVDYFTTLKTLHPELDIVATNNSWGGGGFSTSLLQAITRAANKNILFIAAAGNNSSNNDITQNYPSNYNTLDSRSGISCTYDAVIAVAALQSDGELASYSNYGSTTVDLGAPGTWIFSTIPPNSYKAYSGTSMATPHVTGAAALYAATHTERGAALRTVILDAARATLTASLNTTPKKCETGGRLNVSGF